MATARPEPGDDLIVEHEGRAGRRADLHHQIFAAGRLTAWRLGGHPDAHVRLRLAPDASPGEAGTARASGLAAIRLATPNASLHPAPPLDEVPDADSDSDEPAIPGADVTLWVWLGDAPMQEPGFGIVARNGRIEPAGGLPAYALVHEADVVGAMAYGAYLDYRCGQRTLVEALSGRPSGGWPLLMLAAGLYDGPEHRQRRSRVAADGATLAAWGRYATLLAIPAIDDAIAAAGGPT